MAWFRTKDQPFVEDGLRNLVSNKAKKQYQEISQLIISKIELMLAIADSKYQFYVIFCMLFMIRTYSTAKCSLSLSLLR